MKKGSSSVVTFIVILIIVVAIGAGVYLVKKKPASSSSNSNSTAQTNSNGAVKGTTSERDIVSTPDADIIIFYGSTCPHCKKVNDFILSNNIDQIVKLQHLEVYNNKANLELMKQKLNECKDLSDDDKGGVPFMYSSTKCLVGDQPIIDFLKDQANKKAGN